MRQPLYPIIYHDALPPEYRKLSNEFGLETAINFYKALWPADEAFKHAEKVRDAVMEQKLSGEAACLPNSANKGA